MNKEIDHLLNKNTADVIVKKDLQALLESGEKLKVYLGVDPSGPVIHLGHAVALRKLKEFQDLGHKVILLIGDFTGQIGDPTGKTTARVPLTSDDIKKNAETYKEQASKILDFDGENPARIAFNSKWLATLSFEDLIKLAAHFTVQQMSERDMFQDRLKEGNPIGLHEFFYPLMQGYDSVALEADVEIGGTDQTFNMLCGRTLRKQIEGKDKHVVTVPLLLGTDGRKMSKSFHNDIGISEPASQQYGKLMSMQDDLILDYYTLCTDSSKKELEAIKERLESGENPRDIKAKLAKEVVTMYHSGDEAENAAKEFDRIFKDKKRPTDIPEKSITEKSMTALNLASVLEPQKSRGELKRLFKEGAIKLDNKKILDANTEIPIVNGLIVQIGKRTFYKIKTA
ncbi:tyrosine--tRNA ligase [Patescibacteria group bacterium]|nr:tyrosine--tRNA ligase [Patescibacteria group bacterium]